MEGLKEFIIFFVAIFVIFHVGTFFSILFIKTQNKEKESENSY